MSVYASFEEEERRCRHRRVDSPPSRRTISIFYNLFVNKAATNGHERERVKRMVMEQLALARPEHTVFVNSIGAPLPIPNTTLLAHVPAASEELTLTAIWEHCRSHPRGHNVVYLHSKGSLNAHRQNDVLRMFGTRGALSSECSSMPASCNACSLLADDGPVTTPLTLSRTVALNLSPSPYPRQRVLLEDDAAAAPAQLGQHVAGSLRVRWLSILYTPIYTPTAHPLHTLPSHLPRCSRSQHTVISIYTIYSMPHLMPR